MPTYDYQCTQCKHKLEIFQKISDDPAKKCPKCNKDTLQRGPGGGIGLAFSGPGFYINDYAKGSESPSKPSGGGCCPCGKNKGSCSS